MDDVILSTVKKMLGLQSDYTPFDLEIQIFINAAIQTLYYAGFPGTGPMFQLSTGEETWTEYLGADRLMGTAKSYIYMSVRMKFDPPTTSFAIGAIQDQMQEDLWRLNIAPENLAYREEV